ncbi:MAG: VWA domain-containing protein [Candidatus Absconditabacterales bacterium]|nr:VWA domain-containing protein [Candidatus Absconditabacterales bacterium]
MPGIVWTTQFAVRVGLAVSACIFFVFAALQLSIPTQRTITIQKEFPLVVLFDVSLSMAAQDIKPNRFAVAKGAISDLVAFLDGFPISFIAYSRLPVVLTPFSRDTEGIIDILDDFTLATLIPTDEFKGTGIGDALLLGLRELLAYGHDGDVPGAILLLTDGDSNAGVDPREVLPLIKEKNIPLFTIAVGKDENLVIGTVPGGQNVDAPFNISLLNQMTSSIPGFFVHVQSARDFDQPIRKIARAIDMTSTKSVTITSHSLTPYFLWLSALCVILFCFHSRWYEWYQVRLVVRDR